MTEPNKEQLLMRLLSGVDLFSDFNRLELIGLLSLVQKASFDQDELVFREGERGESLFVLLSGRLEVFRYGSFGDERRIAQLEPGSVVGEMALAESSERSASVRALLPSTALGLAQSSLKRRPELALKIYKNLARLLAQRLRQTNDELLSRY